MQDNLRRRVWIVWRHDNLLIVVSIKLEASPAPVGQLPVLEGEPSTLRRIVRPATKILESFRAVAGNLVDFPAFILLIEDHE